jgi:hypothetical protein
MKPHPSLLFTLLAATFLIAQQIRIVSGSKVPITSDNTPEVSAGYPVLESNISGDASLLNTGSLTQDFYKWDKLSDYWFNSKLENGSCCPAFESAFAFSCSCLMDYDDPLFNSFSACLAILTNDSTHTTTVWLKTNPMNKNIITTYDIFGLAIPSGYVRNERKKMLKLNIY